MSSNENKKINNINNEEKFFEKQDKLVREVLYENEVNRRKIGIIQKDIRNISKSLDAIYAILEKLGADNQDIRNDIEASNKAIVEKFKSVDNVITEIERRDIWKVRAQEVKRLAGDKKVWVIKCPAPDRPVKVAWGDYHFAVSLAKNLEKMGVYAIIDYHQDWYCELDADCVVVLRGMFEYRPDRRNKKCTYIMWNISHPEDIPVEEYNLYDIVCVGSKYYSTILEDKVNVPVYPLLQCTDTDIFYPEDVEKEYDYIFVGNTRGIERKSVKWSINRGIPLKMWGGGWPAFLGRRNKYVVASNIENSQLPDLYRKSRVTVNDHWDDMLEYQFVNNRLFDAVACGLPVVTDYCDEIEEIFGDNILYYSNEEEFNQCIDQLENNYDEIKEKTLSMWDEIKKDYSFFARAEKLIELFDKHSK